MITTKDQIDFLKSLKLKNFEALVNNELIDDIIDTLLAYTGKSKTNYIVNMSKEDYIFFINYKYNLSPNHSNK